MDRKQLDRLNYLVDEFIADSNNYKDIENPSRIEDKKRVLRSLMNIRMPKKMKPEVIEVQDEYLKEVAREKGIVELSDIPVIRDNISIWQGDITRLKVGAIVNAANSMMLGCFVPMHICIDNQIHTFAGIQLREECNNNMQKLREKYGKDYTQPTSIPMLTDAYNLPADKVIHVVGPIVGSKLTQSLEDDLANCYKNILDMCLENSIKSVAFCCISTGVFNFPGKRAAEIATDTVKNWNMNNPNAMDRIIFNVFSDKDRRYYEEILL